MRPGLNSQSRITSALVVALLLIASRARAIDFYEIQIYPTDTTPYQALELELHSNSVTTATGSEAKAELRPYEIHETLEATYGLTPHIEVGQYLCTAKLDNGNYEYSGSRTKLHFGLAPTDEWPVQFGANLELDYMRRAADQNPLTLELRPIIQTHVGKFWLIANFAFEKPFQGPGTHRGFALAPSGEVTYDLFHWLSPALEYYGDMGALEHLPAVQSQQHFIVPALNLPLLPRLELNLGVGIGLTRASNGTFLKSIVGWQF
jgi:hypothetical protein